MSASMCMNVRNIYFVGGLPIESGILPLLKHACVKVIGCYAGCQESAGAAPEVNFRECISPSANKAAHSGFETQRRHHQKSKTGVSVAPQKGLVSSKSF